MVSLSLVSILGILWLWHDTSDVERIAAPRAIDVLVHSSNASDVSCHAGNAAARNRFLANTCNMLRGHPRALSCDNLDARKIRHHALMQRSK